MDNFPAPEDGSRPWIRDQFLGQNGRPCNLLSNDKNEVAGTASVHLCMIWKEGSRRPVSIAQTVAFEQLRSLASAA
jgi:hypothetical protein